MDYLLEIQELKKEENMDREMSTGLIEEREDLEDEE